MTKEELEEIIEEFRQKSKKAYINDDEEKSAQLERFASWVEENIETFEDVEDKDDLWNSFLEIHDEEAIWDSYFPEGDDDDSITDYLTKE